VGGWDRGEGSVLMESWWCDAEYPVSVDIIVFRKGDGLYPIGITLEACDIVVDVIEWWSALD
jgi:hypothetical protein